MGGHTGPAARDQQGGDLLRSAAGVGRPGFRDALYSPYRHDDAAARDRDMERDLDALVGAAGVTARIGSGQVYDRRRQAQHRVFGAQTRRTQILLRLIGEIADVVDRAAPTWRRTRADSPPAART